MLSKKNRLDKHEYKTVFNTGKTLHTPLLMIKSLKKAENKRFSVVIPKKVLKKAYQRNALRRYVYNILKEELASIDDIEVIFIVKKEFNNSNKEVLKEEVLSVLGKLK
jgi:ribonuclease P protein component